MSEKLKKFLEECKEAYYAGEPIISDDQYDHLEEICNEDLSVGTNKGRTKHWYQMYSLQKIYSMDDSPITESCNLINTPKLDGAAIAIRYIEGVLDSVVTRGNGIYGEDITHLFLDKRIFEPMGIPESIDIHHPVQITGEMVAPVYIDNARNYAAGALNLKNAVQFGDRLISFFPYGIQPYPTDFHQTDMKILRDMGFSPIWGPATFEDYPTDGWVHRVDSNKKYEKMGFTSKHPRGAYALKERSEGIKTKIIDVIWQTGKTGKVTPVAILDPIEIEGATVSRATLNNPGFIEALDVKIGDSVMVERAGGIIPRIIRKAE